MNFKFYIGPLYNFNSYCLAKYVPLNLSSFVSSFLLIAIRLKDKVVSQDSSTKCLGSYMSQHIVLKDHMIHIASKFTLASIGKL